jgi:hypothetical protein
MNSRRRLLAYRGDCCAHCGQSIADLEFQYGGGVDRVFEFHHVDPLTKHPQYENLIRRTISTELLDEVDKCVVLCKNCHGIVHAAACPAQMEVTVEYQGCRTTQLLSGQVTTDHLNSRRRFLTNERFLAHPYELIVAEQESQLCFGTELEAGGLLMESIKELPKTKSFSVCGCHDPQAWMKAVTCFTFFGQSDSLFWTAPREPSDVEAAVGQSL